MGTDADTDNVHHARWPPTDADADGGERWMDGWQREGNEMSEGKIQLCN